MSKKKFGNNPSFAKKDLKKTETLDLTTQIPVDTQSTILSNQRQNNSPPFSSTSTTSPIPNYTPPPLSSLPPPPLTQTTPVQQTPVNTHLTQPPPNPMLVNTGIPTTLPPPITQGIPTQISTNTPPPLINQTPLPQQQTPVNNTPTPVNTHLTQPPPNPMLVNTGIPTTLPPPITQGIPTQIPTNTPPPLINQTPLPQQQTPPPQLQTPPPQLQTPPPQLQTPPPQLQTPPPQLQTPQSKFTSFNVTSTNNQIIGSSTKTVNIQGPSVNQLQNVPSQLNINNPSPLNTQTVNQPFIDPNSLSSNQTTTPPSQMPPSIQFSTIVSVPLTTSSNNEYEAIYQKILDGEIDEQQLKEKIKSDNLDKAQFYEFMAQEFLKEMKDIEQETKKIKKSLKLFEKGNYSKEEKEKLKRQYELQSKPLEERGEKLGRVADLKVFEKFMEQNAERIEQSLSSSPSNQPQLSQAEQMLNDKLNELQKLEEDLEKKQQSSLFEELQEKQQREKDIILIEYNKRKLQEEIEDITTNPEKYNQQSSSISQTISSNNNLFEQTNVELLLQEMGAEGNNTTLVNNEDGSQYWYSLSDGSTLLKNLREELLLYNENDIYTRENNEHILLLDPCSGERGAFNGKFTDDISTIANGMYQIRTGDNFPSLITPPWEDMPETLIIPILQGNHWRSVKVDINYNNKTYKVLFDDPFGEGRFPESLKEEVRESLKTNVQLLIETQTGNKNFILPEPDVLEKKEKQQGDDNGWDCGPITFSNIQDYLNAALNNSQNIQYTVPLFSDNGYSNLMAETRKKDIETYLKINPFAVNNQQPNNQPFSQSLFLNVPPPFPQSQTHGLGGNSTPPPPPPGFDNPPPPPPPPGFDFSAPITQTKTWNSTKTTSTKLKPPSSSAPFSLDSITKGVTLKKTGVVLPGTTAINIVVNTRDNKPLEPKLILEDKFLAISKNQDEFKYVDTSINQAKDQDKSGMQDILGKRINKQSTIFSHNKYEYISNIENFDNLNILTKNKRLNILYSVIFDNKPDSDKLKELLDKRTEDNKSYFTEKEIHDVKTAVQNSLESVNQKIMGKNKEQQLEVLNQIVGIHGDDEFTKKIISLAKNDTPANLVFTEEELKKTHPSEIKSQTSNALIFTPEEVEKIKAKNQVEFLFRGAPTHKDKQNILYSAMLDDNKNLVEALLVHKSLVVDKSSTKSTKPKDYDEWGDGGDDSQEEEKFIEELTFKGVEKTIAEAVDLAKQRIEFEKQQINAEDKILEEIKDKLIQAVDVKEKNELANQQRTVAINRKVRALLSDKNEKEKLDLLYKQYAITFNEKDQTNLLTLESMKNVKMFNKKSLFSQNEPKEIPAFSEEEIKETVEKFNKLNDQQKIQLKAEVAVKEFYSIAELFDKQNDKYDKETVDKVKQKIVLFNAMKADLNDPLNLEYLNILKNKKNLIGALLFDKSMILEVEKEVKEFKLQPIYQELLNKTIQPNELVERIKSEGLDEEQFYNFAAEKVTKELMGLEFQLKKIELVYGDQQDQEFLEKKFSILEKQRQYENLLKIPEIEKNVEKSLSITSSSPVISTSQDNNMLPPPPPNFVDGNMPPPPPPNFVDGNMPPPPPPNSGGDNNLPSQTSLLNSTPKITTGTFKTNFDGFIYTPGTVGVKTVDVLSERRKGVESTEVLQKMLGNKSEKEQLNVLYSSIIDGDKKLVNKLLEATGEDLEEDFSDDEEFDDSDSKKTTDLNKKIFTPENQKKVYIAVYKYLTHKNNVGKINEPEQIKLVMMSLVDNEIAMMAQAMLDNNIKLIEELKENDKDSHVFTEINMKEAGRLAQESLDKNLLNAILKGDQNLVDQIILTYDKQKISKDNINKIQLESKNFLKIQLRDAIISDNIDLVTKVSNMLKKQEFENEIVEVKQQAKILLDVAIIMAIRDNKPSEEINKIVEIYDKQKLQKPNIQNLKEKVATKLEEVIKQEALSGNKEKVGEYLKIYEDQKLPKDGLTGVLKEAERNAQKFTTEDKNECIVLLQKSLNTNITIPNQQGTVGLNQNKSNNTIAQNPTNLDKLQTVGGNKWASKVTKQDPSINLNTTSNKLQRTQSEVQISSKVGQGISFANKLPVQSSKSDKSVVRSTSLSGVNKLTDYEMQSDGFEYVPEISKLNDKDFSSSNWSKTKKEVINLTKDKKKNLVLNTLFTAILLGKTNLIDGLINYGSKDILTKENCIKVYNAAAKVLEKMLNGQQKSLAQGGLQKLQEKAQLNITKDNLYKPKNVVSKN
jgi:hypothetical protein